jgi:hypothetical protein
MEILKCGEREILLHTEFLLEFWKQQKDCAVPLARKKQQQKKITKNRKIQKDR